MTKMIPIKVRRRKIVNATSDGRRKEWRYVDVPVEQECKCFTIEYDGRETKFYIPVARMSDNSNPLSHIYNENGDTINAIWQHGHRGSVEHIEPALYDWKRNVLIGQLHYCNGKVIDSYKYMRRVLF